MEDVTMAIPGKHISVPNIKINCHICNNISQMDAIGYILPRNEEDFKANRYKFVLLKVSSDIPLRCECLLSHLKINPIVILYRNNNDDGKFN
jgi:hypothetical protein